MACGNVRALFVGLALALAFDAAAFARYASPDVEALRFALWLTGLTGSGKSFLAKLFMNFFGHYPVSSGHFATWASTANYIQRQGYFFKDAGRVSDLLLGGWALAGSARVSTGYPWAAYLGGGNGIDNTGLNIRFNINPDPSIPWKNPLYDKSCPVERTCEPYFNPSKLIIPPFGTLGDAPVSVIGKHVDRSSYLLLRSRFRWIFD